MYRVQQGTSLEVEPVVHVLVVVCRSGGEPGRRMGAMSASSHLTLPPGPGPGPGTTPGGRAHDLVLSDRHREGQNETGPGEAAGARGGLGRRRSIVPRLSRKGFAGVEADNVDGYTQDSGFDLTGDDQLRFNRMVAELAKRAPGATENRSS